MIFSYHVRRIMYLCISIIVTIAIVQFGRTSLHSIHFPFDSSLIDVQDRNEQLKEVFKLIQSGKDNSKLWRGQQACKHPVLDVDNPEMMSFVHNQEPLHCSPEKDWVIINGSVARISLEARRKYGDIECSFTDLLRANDYSSRMGLTTTTHTELNLESSDFVRVHCVASNGKRWSNIMAGARQEQDIMDRTGWEQLPKEAMHLNVLIMGFDSLSRNTFIRKLPKSYALLKELNAIVLEGYNIVGDGTPQAIIPILTGKTELELPDTRKRMGEKATHVNIYPFVWNNYHKNGYVTGFMEDTPSTGIFTYRLKGFDAVPTDHYMRTFYVDMMSEASRHKPLCVGSLPRHVVMLDYLRHIFTVYHDKPKFLFGFHGELSHDSYNLIGVADDDFVKWIKWFRDNGHLNNTVMIIMSDHGHRFASIRNTQQGKLEERMPFFSFTFPPWFERVYPEAMKNFKLNAHRLTTPFDIHPTLMDILKFEGAGLGDISKRSISLFKEVPLERTCVDAYIEPHWCTCLDWEKYDPQDSLVQMAAATLIDTINRYNSEHSTLCAKLSLDAVLWAAKLIPSKALLKFRGAADKDGFVPDMSGDLDVTMEVYQIKVSVKPGSGLFESSMTLHKKKNKFSLRIEDVSRINKYGPAANCIEQTQEQLRKFCYCQSTK